MEDDSQSDNVTDAALFFRMNVRMMQPERIRGSGIKPSSSDGGTESRLFLLTPVPALLIFLLTPLLP